MAYRVLGITQGRVGIFKDNAANPTLSITNKNGQWVTDAGKDVTNIIHNHDELIKLVNSPKEV